MGNLKIFAVHNDPAWLAAVGERPFLQRIQLDELAIGRFQLNQLCESRIFLSDLFDDVGEECDFVGVMSARYNDKYPLPFSRDKALTRLEDLDQLEMTADRVWAADRAELGPESEWTHPAEEGFHNGHKEYVEDLIDRSGFALPKDMIGLWANNFICHVSVFEEFLRAWRRLFHDCFDQYGVDSFRFDVDQDGAKPDVKAAYFYERITTLYFCSRPDLKICQIP